MSDFSVGKIANNSATLILNSDDENVEIGKRIIVADNTFLEQQQVEVNQQDPITVPKLR
eukprot:SAG31_NODE_9867_length_1219_cov_1.006250_2_plen_59_part_00